MTDQLENSTSMSTEQGWAHDPSEVKGFVGTVRKEMLSFSGTVKCRINKSGIINK